MFYKQLDSDKSKDFANPSWGMFGGRNYEYVGEILKLLIIKFVKETSIGN